MGRLPGRRYCAVRTAWPLSRRPAWLEAQKAATPQRAAAVTAFRQNVSS